MVTHGTEAIIPNLLIPKDYFFDDNNKIFGIWLSGGVDSSILCYLLAKHILDNNLDFKIQPVTIFKNKRTSNYNDVINFIKKSLNCEDLFLEPIVKDREDDDEYTAFFNLNYSNIVSKKYKYIYSGINATPDNEHYTDTWKPIPELEQVRNSYIKKLLVINCVIEIDNTLYEFGEIKPFFNLDKKEIAKLYRQHNLLDTLFPLTISCITEISHCGECWFCKERIWGFGKL